MFVLGGGNENKNEGGSSGMGEEEDSKMNGYDADEVTRERRKRFKEEGWIFSQPANLRKNAE